MAGDGAVVGASSTKDHYAFGEKHAARRAFLDPSMLISRSGALPKPVWTRRLRWVAAGRAVLSSAYAGEWLVSTRMAGDRAAKK